MSSIIADKISGAEAARLVRKGVKLICPVCGVVIRTVPEELTEGRPLLGIECPTNQKHFMIHYDDGVKMRAMRSWMKDRFSRE